MIKDFFGWNVNEKDDLVESLKEEIRDKDMQNKRLHKSLKYELDFKETLSKKIKALIKLNYFAECISNMFDLNSISTDTQLLNCLDKVLEYDKTNLKVTRTELIEQLKNMKTKLDSKNLEIKLYKNAKERTSNTGILLEKIKKQEKEISLLQDKASHFESENNNLLKFIDKMDKSEKKQLDNKKELASKLQVSMLKTAMEDFKSTFDEFCIGDKNIEPKEESKENLKVINEPLSDNILENKLKEVSMDEVNKIPKVKYDIINEIQQVLSYKNINILNVDKDEKLITTDKEDMRYITYADENTELNELSKRLNTLEKDKENNGLRECLHLFVKNRKTYEMTAKVYQHWAFYRTAPYKLMNPFITSFLNIEELTSEDDWDINKYGTENIPKEKIAK